MSSIIPDLSTMSAAEQAATLSLLLVETQKRAEIEKQEKEEQERKEAAEKAAQEAAEKAAAEKAAEATERAKQKALKKAGKHKVAKAEIEVVAEPVASPSKPKHARTAGATSEPEEFETAQVSCKK